MTKPTRIGTKHGIPCDGSVYGIGIPVLRSLPMFNVPVWCHLSLALLDYHDGLDADFDMRDIVAWDASRGVGRLTRGNIPSIFD